VGQADVTGGGGGGGAKNGCCSLGTGNPTCLETPNKRIS